jgi:hypothetical protein
MIPKQVLTEERVEPGAVLKEMPSISLNGGPSQATRAIIHVPPFPLEIALFLINVDKES